MNWITSISSPSTGGARDRGGWRGWQHVLFDRDLRHIADAEVVVVRTIVDIRHREALLRQQFRKSREAVLSAEMIERQFGFPPRRSVVDCRALRSLPALGSGRPRTDAVYSSARASATAGIPHRFSCGRIHSLFCPNSSRVPIHLECPSRHQCFSRRQQEVAQRPGDVSQRDFLPCREPLVQKCSPLCLLGLVI